MCIIVRAYPHLPSGFSFMTLAVDLFCAGGQTIRQHLKTQAGIQGKSFTIFLLCGEKTVYRKDELNCNIASW